MERGSGSLVALLFKREGGRGHREGICGSEQLVVRRPVFGSMDFHLNVTFHGGLVSCKAKGL